MERDSDALEKQFDLYISLLTNRAQCYLIRNDLSESLKDCDKAISLKPDNPKPYFRKAQVLKKLEDWKAALQAIVQGLAFAPDDQSFLREKELIEAKVKEIKSHILLAMRIAELPPDQTFTRIPVRDDIDIEAEAAKLNKPTSASSKASAADPKTAASSRPESKKPLEVVPNAGTAPRSENTSEFMALKNIDGASKSKHPEEEDIEEDGHSKQPQADTKASCKRVRFSLTLETSNKSKSKRTATIKPILKKTSNARAVLLAEDATRLAPAADDQLLKASIKTFLDANRNKIALIKSPSQFMDLWKSFKTDAQARELLLADLGPARFVAVFSKGLEFDFFKELFAFLMYV